MIARPLKTLCFVSCLSSDVVISDTIIARFIIIIESVSRSRNNARVHTSGRDGCLFTL